MPYTTSQAFIDVMIMYAIVIVVSLLVAVVIRVIVWTLSRRASQAETATARSRPTALPPPQLDDQVPAAHLVAIAAAVTMMSGAHRIVRIEAATPSYGWAIAGRSTHHHSHITRRS